MKVMITMMITKTAEITRVMAAMLEIVIMVMLIRETVINTDDGDNRNRNK